MTNTHAEVAILMCTHNGARFLPAQLRSIQAQTLSAWNVWASDDASTDTTADILNQFRNEWGASHLTVVAGPGIGFSANFLSLVCRPEIEAAFYAFCDQDDLWDADKLARALAWLKTVPAHVPALYCGRTRLIDEDDQTIGQSPLFTRFPPSFTNALVQSLAGGNTMVFNAAARALLVAAGPAVKIVSHDWWLYQLVTGCGGQVFYDPLPAIGYRQHGHQLVGSNTGLLPRLSRAFGVFGGRFKFWTDINVAALEHMRMRLTPENQRMLDLMHASRSGWWPGRLAALKKSGMHRQGFVDNVGLALTVLFNRF